MRQAIFIVTTHEPMPANVKVSIPEGRTPQSRYQGLESIKRPASKADNLGFSLGPPQIGHRGIRR